MAFDRFEEGRLLSEDKAAGPSPELQVEGKVASEDPLAQEPGRFSGAERRGHPSGREVGFTVDVEDPAARSRGEGRQQDPFKEAVGIPFHQVPVLEDAGLSLFAVDHQILWRSRRVQARLPLERSGKVRPASPLEPGRLHLFDERCRVSSLQGAGQRVVAALAEGLSHAIRVKRPHALKKGPPLSSEEWFSIEAGDESPRLPLPRDGLDPGREPVKLERGEQWSHIFHSDPFESDPRPALAEKLNHGSGMAHPVAPTLGHGRSEPLSRDLLNQPIQEEIGSDGFAATPHTDEKPEAWGCVGPGLSAELFKGDRRRAAHRLRQEGGRFGSASRGHGVEEPIEVGRADTAVAAAVNLDKGSHRAEEETVRLFEGDAAIRRGFPRFQSTALPNATKQLHAAKQPTTHPSADPDNLSAGLCEPKLRIVSGNAVDLALRDPEIPRDRLKRGEREPSFFLLNGFQGGKEPGALPGKVLEDRPHPLVGPVEHAHRLPVGKSERSGVDPDHRRALALEMVDPGTAVPTRFRHRWDQKLLQLVEASRGF